MNTVTLFGKGIKMYRYVGNSNIRMYDVIGFFGILVLIFAMCICRESKKRFLGNASEYLKNYCFEKMNMNSRFTKDRFWTNFEITIILIIQIFWVSAGSMMFASLIGKAKDYFGFIFGTPICLALFCYVWGIDYLKQLDMITPIFALLSGVLKISCFCAGCCSGFEWSYGLYNNLTKQYEFPVQLLESFLSFLILLIVIKLRKKVKEGVLYPIFLLSYCGERLFVQMLRIDEKIVWIFDMQQIICMIGIVYGVILLYCIYNYHERIQLFFDNKVIENLHAKIFRK